MNKFELERLYGQASAYSEHDIGDQVTFTIRDKLYTGTILWICAPGMRSLLLQYLVDVKEKKSFQGFIFPREIIERVNKHN